MVIQFRVDQSSYYIKKTPVKFTGSCLSLDKVSSAISEHIKAKPDTLLNYIPGRFAIGTNIEPKDLSTEVKIDPRLLAVYHIKNIAKAKNVNIPEQINNPSLSRLKGIIKTKTASGKEVNALTDKAVDTRGLARHGGEWLENAIMYNLMVRGDTAWDSDHKNGIELQNSQGINESGTFLKSIAILPHLKKMNVDTIYLNPINTIGDLGHKGTAGSPYAISDFYEIDSHLDDPLIKTTVDDEFKAFVDAAHKNDMRIMVDFVFRIAAYDNALLIDKPDWCNWRHKNAPQASSDDVQIPSVEEMKTAMKQAYINKYNKQPEKEVIARIIETNSSKQADIKYDSNTITWKEAGLNPKEILQTLKETAHKEPTQAAPPNDDDGQVWSDVTFLRIGKHDAKIPELWNYIENVIPYYQKKYGIDSARIDMAHDLNQELLNNILNKAREIDPDFNYFAEDFSANYDIFWGGNGEKKPENLKFNAACGNMHYVPTYNLNIEPVDLKYSESGYINDWAFNKAKWSDGLIWGSAETHDSSRSAASKGGILHSKATFTRHAFYPKTFPTIISGFELGESESKKSDHEPSILFDYHALKSWTNPNEEISASQQYESNGERITTKNIVDYITKVTDIRNKYLDIVTELHSDSFMPINTGDSPIYTYARIPITKHANGTISDKALLIVQNMDTFNEISISISKKDIQNILNRHLNAQDKKVDSLEGINYKLHDELTSQTYERNSSNNLFVSLKRGQTHIFALTVDK